MISAWGQAGLYSVHESRSICISVKLLKVSAVSEVSLLSSLALLVELKDLIHSLGCNGLRLSLLRLGPVYGADGATCCLGLRRGLSWAGGHFLF